MKPYLLINKRLILITLFFLLSGYLSAQNNSLSGYKINSKGFVENAGQIIDQNNQPNSAVKYLFTSRSFNVQLKQNGFSYDTYTTVSTDSSKEKKRDSKNKELPKNTTTNYHRVDVELVGCNPNAQIVSEGQSKEYYNYFTSGTTASGVHNVHYFQKVIYKDIYPHIDLEFICSQSAANNSIPVEYQFIVHNGGNPENIKLAYKGQNSIGLYDGKLVINVNAGDFTETIPESYFKTSGEPIKVSYAALGSNIFSFSLPKNITITSDLVIDPVPNLVWGTYYGGANDDEANAITIDADSNVYISGIASSTANIATTGAYQTTYGGGSYDAFVAKFNSNATSLLWASYYGGSGNDGANGIALDANKDVYIAGYTTSATGLSSSGAYQTSNGGGSSDAFAAEFNPSGTSLLWGTYYGGSGGDGASGITVDAGNDVYITGNTNSASAIATSGAYQTSFGGGNFDAFAAKFNPSLSGASQLVWGTYYGGDSVDESNGIAIDANKNVYLVGWTMSHNAIATNGAYKTSKGIYNNAFICKLNSSGSSLLWGTYYGGNGSSLQQEGEFGNAIALDASDNVYITGQAGSPSGVATANAYDTSYGKQGVTTFWDAFVAKFKPNGDSLLYGTYFGTGNCSGFPPPIPPDFVGNAIAVDAGENVYITGTLDIGMCQAANMVTGNAYQTNLNLPLGGSSCYVAKFDPTLSNLVWGTYYSGSSSDYGTGIAINALGSDIYVTGLTESTDGIATSGVYQTSLNGSYNAFAAKFNATPSSGIVVNASASPVSFCIGGNDTLTASGASTYTWSPSTGLSATTGSTVIANPTITTTYTVTGTQSSLTASATVVVTVNPIPVIIASPNPASYCLGGNTLITATGGVSYTWTPSSGLSATSSSSVTANPTATTTYTVTGTDSLGCVGSTSVEVIAIAPPNKPSITVSATGDSLISSASSFNQWYFNGQELTDSTRQVLIIKGHSKGFYWVTVTNPANGCSNTSDSTTSINTLATTNQLLIFPNPSTGQFTIKVAGNLKNYTLEIYNVLGEKIYQSDIIEEQKSIDLSDQPSGIYFIYLKSDEKVTVTKVIVTNK